MRDSKTEAEEDQLVSRDERSPMEEGAGERQMDERTRSFPLRQAAVLDSEVGLTGSTPAVLASSFLAVERLLVQADAAAAVDVHRSLSLRTAAAAYGCTAARAVLNDTQLVAALLENPRASSAGNPPLEEFLRVETTLLHLSGMPLADADMLAHELWAIGQPNGETLPRSGALMLDRMRGLMGAVCGSENDRARYVDGPDPDLSPPVEHDLRPRSIWRRLRGRRVLYGVGGVLLTAVNLTAATLISADFANLSMGVGINVATMALPAPGE